jgi:archaellum biogenesis ATPase FlaH
MIMSQSNQEDKSKSQGWIQTGTWLLDQVMQSGIPQGQYNVIVGKSRQTGKSYYTQDMYLKQIRYYMMSRRKEKIKKILDSI